MRKRTQGVIALSLLSLLAAACGSSATGGSQSSDSTITLAFTGTLTGSFASYAQQMQQGFNLAVKQLNSSGGIDGAKISVTYRDDQGQAQNGPVVAREFCANSSVRAVVGFSFSDIAVAAAPVYGQCGLPVVGAAVTSPLLSGISPYFFRTSATDATQGSQMGDYLVRVLGIHRVAVLYQESDYGQGGDAAFTKTVRADGGTILYNQGYQLNTVDYSTPLTKIKSLSPQAIYIDGFYNEAAKIAQQAKGLGINTQLMGTDGSLSPQLMSLGGHAVNGMLLYGLFNPTTPTTAAAKDFVKIFKKAYGQEPSSWAALAYDAVYAISNAAKSAGGTSRQDIERGLKTVSVAGATGAVSFNARGDRQVKIIVLQVKNGQFTLAPKQ